MYNVSPDTLDQHHTDYFLTSPHCPSPPQWQGPVLYQVLPSSASCSSWPVTWEIQGSSRPWQYRPHSSYLPSEYSPVHAKLQDHIRDHRLKSRILSKDNTQTLIFKDSLLLTASQAMSTGSLKYPQESVHGLPLTSDG